MTFSKRVVFTGATFDEECEFASAHFAADTNFKDAQLEGRILFQGAVFAGDASFARARFGGPADFHQSDFRSDVTFREARFDDVIAFGEAIFAKQASFKHASFIGGASFREARFASRMTFGGAEFGATTSFREADLGSEANMRGVTCRDRLWLAPSACGSCLDLGGLVVEGLVRIELPPCDVNLTGAQLRGGGILKAAGSISLADLDCQRGLVVTSGDVMAKIETLAGARTQDLNLHRVDLSNCRFNGATSLSEMSIDNSCEFQRAGGLRTRRDVLMDETDSAAAPKELARIYRGLRRAREEGGDFPGGSDFYYGEMLARIRASGGGFRGCADKALLTAYRLSGGFGVRPMRPFLMLMLLIGLGAVSFTTYGFQCPASVGEAVREAVRSTLFVLRPSDDPTLTAAGDWTIVALRVLGPACLGLLLLGLRSQVRR